MDHNLYLKVVRCSDSKMMVLSQISILLVKRVGTKGDLSVGSP